MNPDYLMTLKSVSKLKKIPNGVLLTVDYELFEILFTGCEGLRLRISQGGIFIDKPSSACIKHSWPETKFSLKETKNQIQIKNESFIIKVTKQPFAVNINRTDGSEILSPVDGTPFYQYQNNHFLLNRKCLPNEHIYGLGEKTGNLDRHGRSLTLWNKDVLAPDPDKPVAELLKEHEKSPLDTEFDPYYMSIPFFYRIHPESLAASGHFIDNPYKGSFNFNNSKNHSHISISFNGGQYCEYFFAGPKISTILEQYTELTGRIERPPLWSLGYHQCRWKKYSQKDLISLAEKQRKSSVPCDVLWLDIDYMDEYRVFTWNDELFPDRESLFNKLTEMGFRVIKIVDPGIKYDPGYSVFDEAREKDLLCKCENGQIYIGQVWPGKTAFPDFSKAECREWWGNKNAELIQEGIAGIWNDMNEPATGKISNSAMRFAGDDNGKRPHERFHNEYALLMAQGTVEGMKKTAPDLRTFVLSRAGSAGIQRYAANWMGDNASRWDHLQMSLPMAMGLGLSGQPFVGADIGGFVEPTNSELFIRWIQCGALTPFCRNHNDDTVDQYVWSFGSGVQKIAEKFIKLRYRLLPYIYSQFVKSSERGCPVQRPLVYDFQDDPACRQIDNQYMFGSDILVAPILEAGATSRHIYLPEGEWFNIENKKFYKGQKWISFKAKIDSLPWFIKCGSVIPTLKEAPESTMSIDNSSLQLICAVPKTNGEYNSILTEDDGTTVSYKNKEELKTQFLLKVSEKAVSLKSSTSGDSFSNFKRSKIEAAFFSRDDIKWNLNGKSLKVKSNIICFENKGESFKLDGRFK